MKTVLVPVALVLMTGGTALAQDRPYAPSPSAGGCEYQPYAPYVDPRIPLGRAAYSQRPRCYSTWPDASPAGPGRAVYLQSPPVLVEAPPVSIGPTRIYVLPPEVIVRPSEVTVEPPEVRQGPPQAE